MGGGGFSMLPPVLKFLIISNVAIFLSGMILGSFYFGEFSVGNLIDAYLPLYPAGHPLFFPTQFVTYMYMHGGFMHVFFNMLMLYFFGLEVEQVLGAKRFFLFYTLCGIGGGLAHWLVSAAPVVGASGAVFGVMVAFAMLYPDRTVYYLMFPIPAKYLVGIYVLLDLFGARQGGGTVAHFAHLGGALVGVVYFLAIKGKLSFGGFGRGSGNRMSGGGRTGGNQDYWQAFQNPWDQAQKKEEASRKPGSGFGNMFKRPNRDDEGTIDAEYYDVNDPRNQQRTSQNQPSYKGRVITQEEIDRILDKIAASGYSNLTEDERQILFEASKKMDERR
jgi:membrane associated rhomboid family serine protease